MNEIISDYYEEIHNSTFDFEIEKLKSGKYYTTLKYKGKMMDEGEMDNLERSGYSALEFEINDHPESYLDFDVKDYPGNFKLSFLFEKKALIGNTFRYMTIEKEDNGIRMYFGLSFGDKTKTMKLNPIRILLYMMKAAKKIGMTTLGGDDIIDDDVYLALNWRIPTTGGNLLKHYKKGVKTLEDAFNTVVEKMKSENKL